jgi:hypothetical protein
MMNQQTLNKYIRNSTIWAEIKAKEQEYQRLNEQIGAIEMSKKDISFEIQKRLKESQEIGEWLLQQEYDALKENNK